MNEEFQLYIDKIIESIGIHGKKEKLIREDLYASLMEKAEATGEGDPYILLGDIEEVAEEFRENLEVKNSRRYRSRYINVGRFDYEFVSKTKIFGIPLVHVNTKPFGIAKGIFSFGTLSIGVFSFGCISMGIISFGAAALGILAALGGISLSGLLSMGGIAVSGFFSSGGLALAYGCSMGGAAISKFIAIGGYAKADIAIGGSAHGIVAVFKQYGEGQYMFKIPADSKEVIAVIKNIYPNISSGIIDFIKIFL